MWQLYALGAAVAAAAEMVIDKAALVRNVQVDFYVASFWRPLMFFVAVMLIGLTGILGPFQLFPHWGILLLAPFGILTALFYTYMMKHVELTSIEAAAYIAPFIFLFIDTHYVHASLKLIQILGICLLVIGGFVFTIDWKTWQFKPELDWRVWSMFLFGIAWSGAEAYLFKYLNASYAISGATFFGTLWFIVSICLLVPIIFLRKTRLLFAPSSVIYIAQSFASKSFDALCSVLWAQALIFAAVSQVSAFDAIYPLTLFILVLVVQGVFRISLKEKLDRSNLGWKVAATVLLVVGGFLVS